MRGGPGFVAAGIVHGAGRAFVVVVAVARRRRQRRVRTGHCASKQDERQDEKSTSRIHCGKVSRRLMCRLLGIVASEPTDFRIVLSHAPRSMAALSREHRDGWGLAVFDATGGRDWRVDRGINPASEDDRFLERAVGSRGDLLIAHIRQKTVGPTSIENTHPFRRKQWVFAHNGTIKNVGWLAQNVSTLRRAEVVGQTDSELFFAYLLTRLDEAEARRRADRHGHRRRHQTRRRGGSRRSRDRCVQLPLVGRKRALRPPLRPHDVPPRARSGRRSSTPSRRSQSGRRRRDAVEYSQRWRRAVFVASEAMTDEPWQTIDDGMLLRLDRAPQPRWRLIA